MTFILCFFVLCSRQTIFFLLLGLCESWHTRIPPKIRSHRLRNTLVYIGKERPVGQNDILHTTIYHRRRTTHPPPSPYTDGSQLIISCWLLFQEADDKQVHSASRRRHCRVPLPQTTHFFFVFLLFLPALSLNRSSFVMPATIRTTNKRPAYCNYFYFLLFFLLILLLLSSSSSSSDAGRVYSTKVIVVWCKFLAAM